MSVKQTKPNLYELFLEHRNEVREHMRRVEDFVSSQPPKCAEQNRLVAKHDVSLYDPGIGLCHRVDVIETQEATKSRGWDQWVAFAAMAVALLALVWSVFTGKI